MPSETEWLDIVVKVDRPLAVLVNNGAIDVWLPKSQIIDSYDELGEGVATKIELPIWLLEEKGLV